MQRYQSLAGVRFVTSGTDRVPLALLKGWRYGAATHTPPTVAVSGGLCLVQGMALRVGPAAVLTIKGQAKAKAPRDTAHGGGEHFSVAILPSHCRPRSRLTFAVHAESLNLNSNIHLTVWAEGQVTIDGPSIRALSEDAAVSFTGIIFQQAPRSVGMVSFNISTELGGCTNQAMCACADDAEVVTLGTGADDCRAMCMVDPVCNYVYCDDYGNTSLPCNCHQLAACSWTRVPTHDGRHWRKAHVHGDGPVPMRPKDEFVHGLARSAACPSGGRPITSEPECRRAAASPFKCGGVIRASGPGNWSHHPKGCFAETEHVHYNEHASGTEDSNFRVLCRADYLRSAGYAPAPNASRCSGAVLVSAAIAHSVPDVCAKLVAADARCGNGFEVLPGRGECRCAHLSKACNASTGNVGCPSTLQAQEKCTERMDTAGKWTSKNMLKGFDTGQYCKVRQHCLHYIHKSLEECKNLCAGKLIVGHAGKKGDCNAISYDSTGRKCTTYAGCTGLGRDANYDTYWYTQPTAPVRYQLQNTIGFRLYSGQPSGGCPGANELGVFTSVPSREICGQKCGDIAACVSFEWYPPTGAASCPLRASSPTTPKI